MYTGVPVLCCPSPQASISAPAHLDAAERSLGYNMHLLSQGMDTCLAQGPSLALPAGYCLPVCLWLGYRGPETKDGHQ